MAFQPSADSFGIRRLGFKCSWWHPRQANDAMALNEAYFAKIVIIKVFLCHDEHVLTIIYRSLCARGGRKLRTDTQTHTHRTTRVTLAARMRVEG